MGDDYGYIQLVHPENINIVYSPTHALVHNFVTFVNPAGELTAQMQIMSQRNAVTPTAHIAYKIKERPGVKNQILKETYMGTTRTIPQNTVLQSVVEQDSAMEIPFFKFATETERGSFYRNPEAVSRTIQTHLAANILQNMGVYAATTSSQTEVRTLPLKFGEGITADANNSSADFRHFWTGAYDTNYHPVVFHGYLVNPVQIQIGGVPVTLPAGFEMIHPVVGSTMQYNADRTHKTANNPTDILEKPKIGSVVPLPPPPPPPGPNVISQQPSAQAQAAPAAEAAAAAASAAAFVLAIHSSSFSFISRIVTS